MNALTPNRGIDSLVKMKWIWVDDVWSNNEMWGKDGEMGAHCEGFEKLQWDFIVQQSEKLSLVHQNPAVTENQETNRLYNHNRRHTSLMSLLNIYEYLCCDCSL